jgi:hypothetical protein
MIADELVLWPVVMIDDVDGAGEVGFDWAEEDYKPGTTLKPCTCCSKNPNSSSFSPLILEAKLRVGFKEDEKRQKEVGCVQLWGCH